MNFIKTSFLSGLSTVISLLARLISTKIVAVYLGTNGMFLMGQLKDFLRLGNTIGSFGIENGIVKYVSEYENEKTKLGDIIGTSFKKDGNVENPVDIDTAKEVIDQLK